eukprot:2640465-Rhodomonas_salina.1
MRGGERAGVGLAGRRDAAETEGVLLPRRRRHARHRHPPSPTLLLICDGMGDADKGAGRAEEGSVYAGSNCSLQRTKEECVRSAG